LADRQGRGRQESGDRRQAEEVLAHERNLLRPFREFQEQGLLEIATCAATPANAAGMR